MFFFALLFAVKPKTPSISVSPSDAYVEKGTSVTLSCTTASSSSSFEYEFKFGTTSVYTGELSSKTLTVDPTMSGTYICLVRIRSVASAASTGHPMTVVGRLLS